MKEFSATSFSFSGRVLYTVIAILCQRATGGDTIAAHYRANVSLWAETFGNVAFTQNGIELEDHTGLIIKQIPVGRLQ